MPEIDGKEDLLYLETMLFLYSKALTIKKNQRKQNLNSLVLSKCM